MTSRLSDDGREALDVVDRDDLELFDLAIRPIPQYDLLLSSQHPTDRTIANAVYDSEIRPKLGRTLNLNVEAMLVMLHKALRKHLGESVPKPTVWVGVDKVKSEGDWKPNTMTTFAVGKVGNQKKHYTVYQASEE